MKHGNRAEAVLPIINLQAALGSVVLLMDQGQMREAMSALGMMHVELAALSNTILQLHPESPWVPPTPIDGDAEENVQDLFERIIALGAWCEETAHALEELIM